MVVTEAVAENLYFNTFYNLDNDSKEWEEIAQYIFDYVPEKFGERIKEYYMRTCD